MDRLISNKTWVENWKKDFIRVVDSGDKEQILAIVATNKKTPDQEKGAEPPKKSMAYIQSCPDPKEGLKKPKTLLGIFISNYKSTWLNVKLA